MDVLPFFEFRLDSTEIRLDCMDVYVCYRLVTFSQSNAAVNIDASCEQTFT